MSCEGGKEWGEERPPAFLLILGMDVVVDGGAEPVALGVVQHGGQGVRHVDDPTRVAAHHKQEPVSRLQDQVFQLVICNNSKNTVNRYSVEAKCAKKMKERKPKQE